MNYLFVGIYNTIKWPDHGDMRIYIDPLLTAQDIMRIYGLSRSKAYKSIQRGYVIAGATATSGRPKTRTVQGFALADDIIERIARHTASHLAGSSAKIIAHGHAISDLQDEIAQAARIELWIAGCASEALAYVAAKRAGLNTIRKWYTKHNIPLEEWALENEPEIDDSNYE